MKIFLRAHWAIIISCLLVVLISSCSIPNLEKPECTESRNVVKEFYSYHFGNDMKFSQENLKLREKFFTPAFAASFKNETTENDVFTVKSADLPKAFRIGACEAVSPEKTIFTVIFFWKDEVRSEQKEIKVETAAVDGKWLISKIDN